VYTRWPGRREFLTLPFDFFFFSFLGGLSYKRRGDEKLEKHHTADRFRFFLLEGTKNEEEDKGPYDRVKKKQKKRSSYAKDGYTYTKE